MRRAFSTFLAALLVALPVATSVHAGINCGNLNGDSPTGPSGDNPGPGGCPPGGPAPTSCPTPSDGSQPPGNGDPNCSANGSNESINALTANDSRLVTDLPLFAGAGQHRLSFTRLHLSRLASNSKFGDGVVLAAYSWRMADAGDAADPQAILEIYRPDGAVRPFTRSAADPDQWTPAPNVAERLYRSTTTDAPAQPVPPNHTAASPRTLYTLRNADGWEWEFEQFTTSANTRVYLLTEFRDPEGLPYRLRYNSSRQLLQVTEPAGRSLSFTYTSVPINNPAYTVLNTIAQAPASGQWGEVTLPAPAPALRYLRYFGPYGQNSRIAEIEFYDQNDQKITGTPVGNAPARNPGSEFDKATDGDPSTAYEFVSGGFGFAGLDLGPNPTARVTRIRYRALPGKEASLVGGRLEGSNAAPSTRSVMATARASDGRQVTYSYGLLPDPQTGQDQAVLSRVDYPDATSATYTWTRGFSGSHAVLQESNDVRSSGAPRVRYEYYPGSPAGGLRRETNPDTGAVMATLETDPQGGNRITYANGAVRKWRFNTTVSDRITSIVTPSGASRAFTFTGTVGTGGGTLTGHGTITGSNSTLQGYVASVTDELGHVTSFARDPWGRKTATTLPGGATATATYDTRGRTLVTTDELGRATTRLRDAKGRVSSVSRPDGATESWTYSALNKPLTRTDPNGAVTSYAYDARGNLLTRTDPLGHTTTYTYNALDLPVTVTDPLGRVTRHEYNLRGQITRTTHPDNSTVTRAYDPQGNRTSVTNELGQTWTTTYDEFRRPRLLTDPLGRVTEISYGIGLANCGSCHTETYPTLIIHPDGRRETFTYDPSWRLLARTDAEGTPDAATTTYAYDLRGNLLTVTDPLNRVTSFAYDQRDRRVSLTDPLGRVTTTAYNDASQVTATTDPLGHVTTRAYDNAGRLASVTNPNNETTAYTYTPAGDLLALTDAKNQTHTWTYDPLRRPARLTYPAPAPGIPAPFEAWTYDSVGNRVTTTNRSGQTMTCAYDLRNRDTACTWSGPAAPGLPALPPAVTKTYDPAGRLLTATTAGVLTCSYAYDPANQLLSETTQEPGQPPRAVAYTYDPAGRRATLAYPDGHTIAYTYTPRGQLRDVLADGPPPLATYTYDLAGQILTRALENGTTTTHTYDQAGQILAISHTSGAAPIATLAYTYDLDGRRATRAQNAVPETYGYDPLGQLTSATTPAGATTTTYDPVGNRLTHTTPAAAATYTANPLNQYTAVGAPPAPAYDFNGNLLTLDGATYTYDANNRLLAATNATSTATITYDHLRRPVTRTLDGTTTRLLWDGWTLLAEYDTAGTLQIRYIHGPGVDNLLAKTDATGTLYYHQDALGSTVALTTATGAVAETYTYTPFGAPTIHDPAGNTLPSTQHHNRFLYTGREYLATLRIYDYRNRHYSPALARFLQTDPIRFDGGDLNLYRYAGNRTGKLDRRYGTNLQQLQGYHSFWPLP